VSTKGAKASTQDILGAHMCDGGGIPLSSCLSTESKHTDVRDDVNVAQPRAKDAEILARYVGK